MGTHKAADFERPAAGHEAKGIQRQIEQHLFQPVAVGRDQHAIQVCLSAMRT